MSESADRVKQSFRELAEAIERAKEDQRSASRIKRSFQELAMAIEQAKLQKRLPVISVEGESPRLSGLIPIQEHDSSESVSHSSALSQSVH
jgi:5-formyltetrahydrofolate cyclo-ligase